MHDSIVANTSKLRRYYRSSNHNWFYDSHYRFLNNARWCLVFKWRVSSVVEQLTVNQFVVGSNPALAAMFNFKCYVNRICRRWDYVTVHHVDC